MFVSTLEQTIPNSGAAAALWRRWFAMEEEKEIENVETVVSSMEGEEVCESEVGNLVASERAVQARVGFMRDYYRKVVLAPENSAHTTIEEPSTVSQLFDQMQGRAQLEHPTLVIPVGDKSVYLAQ